MGHHTGLVDFANNRLGLSFRRHASAADDAPTNATH